MTTNNRLSDRRKRVLVFNPLKRFVAIFQSCTATASAFGVSNATIHGACVGNNISCCSLYFRYLYEDKIEIETLSDLGTLRLEDYDRLMGLQRTYYPTKVMSRKDMKNNKKNK